MSLTSIAPILLALTACLISLFATGLMRQHFSKTLLDLPNERSSHTQPTPRGGGAVFLLAFLLTYCSAQWMMPDKIQIGWAMWVVVLPLAVVGLIDDRATLPAHVRYVVQLLAASIAVGALGYPLPPEGMLSPRLGHTVLIAFTIIAFTALINFYNFMDGLDGLVASVTAVQFGFLALYLQQPIWWLLVGALCGFLYWNWSPAKIFMGDVGSTVLGATVAIALLQAPSPTQLWTATVVTLPLIGDAIYTLLRRLLKGENIFCAHRTHLYQRLQQSGWSHAQVALTYLSSTGLMALLISSRPRVGSVLGLLLTLGAIATAEIHLHQKKTDKL